MHAMHVPLVKLLYDATMKSRTSSRALMCLLIHIAMHHHTDDNDNDEDLKMMISFMKMIFLLKSKQAATRN